MNALDDLEPTDEPLHNGGGLLLQLVAAVDYLGRGFRPGFTVWDAIEEALRWHGEIEPGWTDPDPLLRTLRLSFSSTAHRSAADTLAVAIRHWVDAAAAAYNDSIPWELSSARALTAPSATGEMNRCGLPRPEGRPAAWVSCVTESRRRVFRSLRARLGLLLRHCRSGSPLAIERRAVRDLWRTLRLVASR